MVIKSVCSGPSGAHILKSFIFFSFFSLPSSCRQRPARKGHHNHRNWVSLLLRRASCSPRCLHARGLEVISSFDLLLDWQPARARTMPPSHHSQVLLFSNVFIYLFFEKEGEDSRASFELNALGRSARRSALTQTSCRLRRCEERRQEILCSLQSCALLGSNDKTLEGCGAE